MKRIYQKIKLKTLKYENYEGVVCGYNDTHFILAVSSRSARGFRAFGKGEQPFIEEEFKGNEYKYQYCNEADIYAQHPRMKRI